MSKKLKREESSGAEADMTPMLDIVFILLIFFIVTTSFVKEEGLVINRPDAHKKSTSQTKVVMVRIDESGTIFFNNKRVDAERLAARIESFLAKNDSTSAVIIPTYDTKHADVVKVLDIIKSFESLTIAIGN